MSASLCLQSLNFRALTRNLQAVTHWHATETSVGSTSAGLRRLPCPVTTHELAAPQRTLKRRCRYLSSSLPKPLGAHELSEKLFVRKAEVLCKVLRRGENLGSPSQDGQRQAPKNIARTLYRRAASHRTGYHCARKMVDGRVESGLSSHLPMCFLSDKATDKKHMRSSLRSRLGRTALI